MFETYAGLFYAEIRGQLDEGGGRILLGDNTNGWAIMPQPIRFHCAGVRVSSGLPLCKHKRIRG